jgi:ABC-2 type transport system ATP-binding protein
MSAIVLEVNDARRAFAGRQALQGISLTVSAGEIVALLGPNGSGKTTLMRAIAGRLALDQGSASVLGLNPRIDSRARQALGIVPQTIALYPQLTGRQNLEILARLSGLKKSTANAAVEEALMRTDLVDRADEQLTALSGGMQRRLNIIAGTLHRPKLLLLDEPTVGVDIHARESIHSLLKTLSKTGIAILLSTHDFDQAAEVADRVVFISQGRLLIEGPVAGLIRDYFGDAKEAVVTLAHTVTPAALGILTDFGLSASREELVWSGPIPDGYAKLELLESRMEKAGVHIAEMRIREPGLGGVFIQLMDKGART